MRWVLMLLLACTSGGVVAAPDRAGLIQAWEADMGREGALERQPDGSYRYQSEALGYSGTLKVLAAILPRDNVMARADKRIEATGSVDFELSDLSPPQRESMTLRSWIAQRQQYVYDRESQAWISMMGYYQDQYGLDENGDDGVVAQQSSMWWFGDIGLLLVLAAAVVVLLVLVARQARKAGAMYREAREINQLARENIERARELHEANAAAVRESLDTSRRSAESLDAILAELRRGRG